MYQNRNPNLQLTIQCATTQYVYVCVLPKILTCTFGASRFDRRAERGFL